MLLLKLNKWLRENTKLRARNISYLCVMLQEIKGVTLLHLFWRSNSYSWLKTYLQKKNMRNKDKSVSEIDDYIIGGCGSGRGVAFMRWGS